MQRPHSTASRSLMAPQSQPRPEVTSAGIPTPMSRTLSSPHTCYKGADAVTLTTRTVLYVFLLCSVLNICYFLYFSCREQNSYRGNQGGGMRPQNMGVNNPNQQMNMGPGGGMGMNRGYSMAEQGNMPQRGVPPYTGGNRMNPMNQMNPMHQMNQMNSMHQMNNMGQMNQMNSMHPMNSPMNSMNQMGPMNQMSHHGMHQQQHQHQQMGQYHGGGGGPGGGGYGMGMTSPPQASPGINAPPHNVMSSPRVRGSPKMGASPFSPGGMNQTYREFMKRIGSF